ncbi:hypothetical protein FGG08_007552, partial [Glutinoglossum americanum]
KIYFRAVGGYALAVATQTIGQTQLRTYNDTGNTPVNAYTFKDVSASFGAGANFNVAAGYMFSKFIGVDLNVQYLKSKKYEISDKFIQTSSPGNSGRDESTTTVSSSAIFINPSVIITPGAGSKVPYGRFGVIIGSPKLKSEESSYYDLDGKQETEREQEYKKGTAFGFQGAVGLNWMISNNLDIYAEVNFISLTWYPAKSEITKYMVSRDDDPFEDVLPDISVRDKKFEYKKEVEFQAQSDPDKPQQQLRQSVPFSSVALQLGIKFTLGGHAAD